METSLPDAEVLMIHELEEGIDYAILTQHCSRSMALSDW